MTDVSITPANVLGGAGSTRVDGIAGETIAAGKAVYFDTATRTWKLADSNSGTAAARKAGGIALNGASLNQPIAVQKSGDITVGGTLVPGTAYYLSDTPGGICPLADVGNGEYICLLGLAKSASVLTLDIQFPNVAVAT